MNRRSLFSIVFCLFVFALSARPAYSWFPGGDDPAWPTVTPIPYVPFAAREIPAVVSPAADAVGTTPPSNDLSSNLKTFLTRDALTPVNVATTAQCGGLSPFPAPFDGRCARASGCESMDNRPEDCLAAYRITCDEDANPKTDDMQALQAESYILFNAMGQLLCSDVPLGASGTVSRTFGSSLYERAAAAVAADPSNHCTIAALDPASRDEVPCN